MSVATGIALWAQVQRPSTMFDKQGEWTIDLIVDAEIAKDLTSQGLVLKDIDKVKEASTFASNGSKVIKIKQKAARKDGSPNAAPSVVNKTGEPITDLIGNGSTVSVQFKVGQWAFGAKKGTAAYLEAVQVLELVPYVKKLEFDIAEKSGSEGVEDPFKE